MKKLLGLYDNLIDIQTATQHTTRVTVAGKEVLYVAIEAKDRDDDGDLDVVAAIIVGGKKVLAGEIDLGDINYADFDEVMNAAAEFIEEQLGIDIPGLGK